MEDQMPRRASSGASSFGAAVRRPLLIALGAGLLLFAIICYLPTKNLSWLSWHLYLDRVSPLFALPLGWNARLGLGAGLGGICFIAALFVGLVWPRRVALADDAELWSYHAVDTSVLDEFVAEKPVSSTIPFAVEEDELPVRNKQDIHPDDAPRPPLSAERDLPAGGLCPDVPAHINTQTAEIPPKADAAAAPNSPVASDAVLILAELAPDAGGETVSEPWFEPVDQSGPAKPQASDLSLFAMVERLEAGFLRRRRPAPAPEALLVPMPDPIADITPMRVEDHQVDLALEAALSTLHRMNLRAAAG